MGGILETVGSTGASGVCLATHDVPRPQLLLLVERAQPLAGGSRYSLANIDRVTIGRGERRTARRVIHHGRPTLEIVIPDERISMHHARIDRDGEMWRFVDCGSTNGVRVNQTRTKASTISDGDVLEVGRTLFRFRSSMMTPINAPADVDMDSLRGLSRSFGTLLPWLERDLETLARVARSEFAVLLLGETGAGKEVLARAIHEHSGRTGRFVAVNCGGLPVTLLESLLFGHKRGAFSGALQDEIGFVRAAEGGTLFLDEVGDLPGPGQAALLRVLQEREVIPVGSTRPIAVDVRIVAATHRPLPTLVRSKAFRQDLFARLSAFSYAVPPLRDRIDDIGMLIAALLGPVARTVSHPLSLSSETPYALLGHSWPHNVRELEQRLKVGALLSSDGRIELGKASLLAAVDVAAAANMQRKPVTLEELVQALRVAPNTSVAAKMLRIHRSHFYRLIRHFGIDPRSVPADRRLEAD